MKTTKPAKQKNHDSGKRPRKQINRSRKRPYVVKAFKTIMMRYRVSEVENFLIAEAARLQGYTISDFMVRPALAMAKKYLQQKGYKISKIGQPLRGIDRFLKPDRIMFTSIRTKEQFDSVIQVNKNTADEVQITAHPVQNLVNHCPNCNHS